jgi:hypothetical protein
MVKGISIFRQPYHMRSWNYFYRQLIAIDNSFITQPTIQWAFRRVDFGFHWASKFQIDPSDCHFPTSRGLSDRLLLLAVFNHSNGRFRRIGIWSKKKNFYSRDVSISSCPSSSNINFESSKPIEYMRRSRFEHQYLRLTFVEQLI